jgi:hypothetical protein
MGLSSPSTLRHSTSGHTAVKRTGREGTATMQLCNCVEDRQVRRSTARHSSLSYTVMECTAVKHTGRAGNVHRRRAAETSR